jgi:hypothetical protein
MDCLWPLAFGLGLWIKGFGIGPWSVVNSTERDGYHDNEQLTTDNGQRPKA